MHESESTCVGTETQNAGNVVLFSQVGSILDDLVDDLSDTVHALEECVDVGIALRQCVIVLLSICMCKFWGSTPRCIWFEGVRYPCTTTSPC